MLATAETIYSSQDAPPVCLWKENPNRLVSLLMLIEEHADDLFLMGQTIGLLRKVSSDHGATGKKITASACDQLHDILVRAIPVCFRLALKQSSFFIGPALKQLQNGQIEDWFSSNGPMWLATLMTNELRGVPLFTIKQDCAQYYLEPMKGWEEACSKFPEISDDVEEASKCFSLGRYAACVFHVMRAVEIVIPVLAKIIELKDHAPSWGSVLQKLEKSILKTPYGDRSALIQEHFTFLEQVLPEMQAIQRAWRNKVSHCDAKLIPGVPIFTEEVAKEIMQACMAFMRHLSVYLPRL